MLAILYVLCAFALGWVLVHRCAPLKGALTGDRSLAGPIVAMPSTLLMGAAALLVGLMVQTSVTFAFTYLFASSASTLAWANAASTIASSVAVAILLILRLGRRNVDALVEPRVPSASRTIFDLAVVGALIAVWSFFIWRSLSVDRDILVIGASVNSDFGPHTALARSFSFGKNFPPQYPHFPDGTIRYHFLFQFLVGNLEFLGMRLDWAFNLPSILGFGSFVALLYGLALRIGGSRAAAAFTLLFFLCRSSWAFFTFLEDQGSIEHALTTLATIDRHIGKTSAEDWGLWAQKSLVNQRHMPFALGIGIVAVMMYLPLLQRAFAGARAACSRIGILSGLREFAASTDAWLPRSWSRPIVTGLLLGMCSYWNGAVVIAFLLILGVVGIFSRNRLEFAIAALIAIGMTLLLTRLFIGTGAAVKPEFVFGFMAREKTMVGVLGYFCEVLGVFVPLAIMSAVFLPGAMRVLVIAFLSPVALACTLKLTPDLMVNYKFVVIATYLTNALIAVFLAGVFHRIRAAVRSAPSKAFRMHARALGSIGAAAIGITIAAMVVTGVVDLKSLYNIDRTTFRYELVYPMSRWVREHTAPRAVFLTDIVVCHPILLGGRPVFVGWPYFAWSAGYDTGERQRIAAQIYAVEDSAAVIALIAENRISYVVFDDAIRHGSEVAPRANEAFFSGRFPLVYTDPWRSTSIYDVRR